MDYKPTVRYALFTSAILCLLCGFGDAFNFEVTPNTVNVRNPTEVTMRCTLDQSDSKVLQVLSMKVSKGDVPIATLRPASQITLQRDLTSTFKADGRIGPSIQDSYLTVTLVNPKVEDTGSYSCLMSYMDEPSVATETKQSASLTVKGLEPPAIRQMVKGRNMQLSPPDEEPLDSTVQFLVRELARQRAETEGRNAELQRQIRQLQERESSLMSKVTRLEDMTRSPYIDGNNVTEDNSTVFFMAQHNRTGDFRQGNTLVFSIEIHNIGGGYNTTTGVFTAPVDGYYLFQLSLFMYYGRWMFIDLETSDFRTLTRMYVGDGSTILFYTYSDASCIARLQAGTEVYPVIRDVLNYPPMIYGLDSETPDLLNKFYGFLLRPMDLGGL